jgi:hypothetical protein
LHGQPSHQRQQLDHDDVPDSGHDRTYGHPHDVCRDSGFRSEQLHQHGVPRGCHDRADWCSLVLVHRSHSRQQLRHDHVRERQHDQRSRQFVHVAGR